MSFNINNVNKKIVIIFSLLGFILSFISALVSGITFFNVLFRSIVSGIAVGIIITICNLVIMVFLPELLEPYSESTDNSDDSEGQVDIVMPEEGYTVQRDDQYDGSEMDYTEAQAQEVANGASASGSEFKEVDMSNLKDLSSSADYPVEEADDDYQVGDGLSPMTSANSDSIAGEHSVEEMAKAVKTVLKKD